MADPDLIFKCKYCRRTTNHKLDRVTEYKAKKAQIYECRVCKHTCALYRDNNGKLKVDQSETPERMILLPYDTQAIQEEIVSQSQEDANKEIDDWLIRPNRFPVTRAKKGER